MNNTMELRWFFQKDSFKATAEWLENYSKIPIKSEKPRTDHYLLFPGCDSVGVKVREGRFEIKTLIHSPRPVNFDFGVSGKIYPWAKWTTEFPGIADLVNSDEKNGKWIEVKKTRLQRKFSADKDRLKEVKENEMPELGCTVEATFIEIDAKPRKWVTVAFEAFGSIPAAPGILDETVRKFFSDYKSVPGEKLSVHSSFSYAAWLAGF